MYKIIIVNHINYIYNGKVHYICNFRRLILKKQVCVLLTVVLGTGQLPMGSFAEATQSTEGANRTSSSTTISEPMTKLAQVTSGGAITPMTSSAAISIELDTDIDLYKINTEQLEIRGKVVNYTSTGSTVEVYFNNSKFTSPIDESGRFKFTVKFVTGYNSLHIEYDPHQAGAIGYNKGFGQIQYNMVDGGALGKQITPDWFKMKKGYILKLGSEIQSKIIKDSCIKMYRYNPFSDYKNALQLVATYDAMDKNGARSEIPTGLDDNAPLFKSVSNCYIELIDKTGKVIVAGQVGFTAMNAEYPKDEPFMVLGNLSERYTKARIKIGTREWIDLSNYLDNGVLKIPKALFPYGKTEFELRLVTDSGSENYPQTLVMQTNQEDVVEPLAVQFATTCNVENLPSRNTVLKGRVSPFSKGITQSEFYINGECHQVTLNLDGSFEVPVQLEAGYNVLSIINNHRRVTQPIYCELPTGGSWLSEMNTDKSAITDSVVLLLNDDVASQIKSGMTVRINEHTTNMSNKTKFTHEIGTYAVNASQTNQRVAVTINRNDIQAYNPYLGYSYDLLDSTGVVVKSYRIDIPTFVFGGVDIKSDSYCILTPFMKGNAITVGINGKQSVDYSNQTANGITHLLKNALNSDGKNELRLSLNYKNFIKEGLLEVTTGGIKPEYTGTVVLNDCVVTTDTTQVSKLKLKGQIDQFNPEVRSVQVTHNAQSKQVEIDKDGKFESEIILEKGLNSICVQYGKNQETIQIKTELPQISVKDDSNQSYLLLQTPNFIADKILIKVGSGSEVDVTGSYNKGILTLKKDLFAVGSNTVVVTMKVGNLTYKNTLAVQKQSTTPSGSTTGGTTTGGSSSSGSGSSGGYTGSGTSSGGSSSGGSVGGSAVSGGVSVSPSAKQTSRPTAVSFYNLISVKQETIDGKQVARGQFNKDALLETLKKVPENESLPLIVMSVASKTGTAIGEIDSKSLVGLADRKATIQLNTDEYSFNLPISEINTTAIAQKLSQKGLVVTADMVELKLVIDKNPTHALQVLEQLERNKKLTVLSMPVSFMLSGISKGNTVEIKTFSKWAEKRMIIDEPISPSEIVTAVIIEKDGSLRSVPTKIEVDNGKKYAVFQSFTNSEYAVIKTTPKFNDIDGHWSKAYIETVSGKMIMTGTGQRFNPDKNISRGDLAVALVKAFGLCESGNNAFNDLMEDQRAGYIQTAIQYGLVTGYKDNTFKPNQYVSREEAMCMIRNAAKFAGLDVNGQNAESRYKDQSQISNWAKASVNACTQLGLIKGDGGYFKGKGNLTNAEFAVILAKLLDKANLI